jgi:hypothetical protein
MNVTTNYQLAAETLLGHNGYGNVYIRLYVKYNSQSVANNTTNVSIQARIYTLGGWWRSDTGTTYNIQASPNHTTGTVSCNGRFEVGETTLGTLTKDISHNTDGTYKLSAEASFVANPWGWNGKAWNGDLILPTIARASSVSCSSPYIGDAATIVIYSASSSFSHTLGYSFGSETGTIASKTNNTTIQWDTNSIKTNLYAQIPNAQEGSGTITCKTYSGDTLIGTKTCTFNLYAKKSDCVPGVSGTVVDTNAATIALTGNSSKLIRYMSKPKITVSATAKYSSSIKSYSINADGKTINASETTLSSITSNQITVNATDSRGYDNPTTLTPEMVSYIKLNSNLTITRPEQTSNEAYLNGSGQWFNGSFSDSNANTLTITCQYRKSGDSTWTDLGTLTPTISGNTFSFSNLKLGDSFNYKEEYQFKITITDKLETIGNQTKDIIILSTGTPIIRVGKDKVLVNGMLKINDKTINNTIIVSPNEPTGNEDIWIQKGNNLLDITKLNLGYINGSTGGVEPWDGQSERYTEYIKVNPNTTYTFSILETSDSYEYWISVAEYTSSKTFIQRPSITGSSDFTFTTTSSTGYIIMSARNLKNATQVALEEGNCLTRKIYTKNSKNNKYEKFYDETDSKTYSTAEKKVGFWIDGKPTYRRTLYSTKRVESGAGYMDNTIIPNIDVVTDLDVVIGAFGNSIFKSYWTNDGGNLKIKSQFDKANGLYISCDYTGFIGWILTVEYTKTTD